MLPPGRLSLFQEEWSFLSLRETIHRNHFLCLLSWTFDDAVIFLLEKRAINEIDFEDGFFWSTVFAIPKKIGFRPIFNLRRLNNHIVYEHFQMESLDSLRRLIQTGD